MLSMQGLTKCFPTKCITILVLNLKNRFVQAIPMPICDEIENFTTLLTPLFFRLQDYILMKNKKNTKKESIYILEEFIRKSD